MTACRLPELVKLEHIDTQVLLVFLRSLLTRLRWDSVLQRQLDSLRQQLGIAENFQI